MPELKTRMGEVEVDETWDISTLGEAARGTQIKISDGKRKYLEEIVEEDNYLYVLYHQEITEERSRFTVEEEEELEEAETAVEVAEQDFAQSMRFLLRDDGYYAFQATTGVQGEHAIDYLFEELEVNNYECNRIDSFPQQWMNSFYSSVFSVRKVKLENIGESDEEQEIENSTLVDLVEEAGEPTDWATFSTGGRDNNLRTSSLIDALARLSDIDFISGRTNEDEIEKLSQNGKLTIRYPSDLGHEGQAQRMYEATEKILNNV